MSERMRANKTAQAGCHPWRPQRSEDDEVPACEHPYTEAYDDGGVVYVSGALSVDPSGHVVGGRREALDAALEKLRVRLGTVGLGLADVVKTTYFVTDVSLRDEANEQFVDVFAEPRPARSFIEVSRLPYGATVEIEAVARRGKSVTG